jgi:hypothetical protein
MPWSLWYLSFYYLTRRVIMTSISIGSWNIIHLDIPTHHTCTHVYTSSDKPIGFPRTTSVLNFKLLWNAAREGNFFPSHMCIDVNLTKPILWCTLGHQGTSSGWFLCSFPLGILSEMLRILAMSKSHTIKWLCMQMARCQVPSFHLY